MANNIVPIQSSTQEHVEILDVLDDIVVIKDGSCAVVLGITAINFDLLSEMEQEAIIYAYAGLLNSLNFTIQIVIRSAIKDVTNYINLIKQQEQKQKKQLLLEQLKQYHVFVENLVKDNRVLDKKFYVIIPFTNLELGLAPTIGASFQKTKKLPYPKHHILERAKMNLYPKRDHLMRQFARLGLRCKQLNTQQLIELFYGMYNEEAVGQRMVLPKEYTAPIVSAKISAQAPKMPSATIPPQTTATDPVPVAQPAPQVNSGNTPLPGSVSTANPKSNVVYSPPPQSARAENIHVSYANS